MAGFHRRDTSLDRAALDPSQHVNFVQGMVLGVDDFNQEFAYHAGHDQWMSRGAIGYGTVRGLRVRVAARPSDGEWEVVVCPGGAATPQGRWVRVPSEQCATLSAWLAEHVDELPDHVERIEGDRLVLHVVLRYRECFSDPVPVPGDACRTEEDSVQPSRITDNFELSLEFDPPPQAEEEAVQALVRWMREHIRVRDEDDGEEEDVSPPSELEDALAGLRATATWDASHTPEEAGEAEFPRGTETTPCADAGVATPESFSRPGVFELTGEEARAFVERALRMWVIELRPRWHRDRFPRVHGPHPESAATPDEGILLSTLTLSMRRDNSESPWLLDATTTPPATSDDTERPWLLHLRMLQELILQSFGHDWNLYGDVTGTLSDTRVERIQTVPVEATTPSQGDVLYFVIPEEGTGSWRPFSSADLTIAGDVNGRLGDARVERLRGVGISATAPGTDGQVLTFRGGEWVPEVPTPPAPPALTGDVVYDTAPATRVTALQHRAVRDLDPLPADLLAWGGAPPDAPWEPMGMRGDLSLAVGTETTEGGSRDILLARVRGIVGIPVEDIAEPPIGAVPTLAAAGESGLVWRLRVPPTGGEAVPAVIRPEGAEGHPISEYRIVAAGTIRMVVGPGFGTPGLRVLRVFNEPEAPVRYIEFTFNDYAARIRSPAGELRSLRERPLHFVVKTTLVNATFLDVMEIPSLAALTTATSGSFANLRRTLTNEGRLQPTIAVAAFTQEGIVLRLASLQTLEPLLDDQIAIEVSWCPDFRVIRR